MKSSDALSDSRREHTNYWFFNTLLSRLVVMQRLHIDDLTGRLLRDSDEWTVLSLPAVAEQEQFIVIADDNAHRRRLGDLLHPEREPQEILDSLRNQLGSDIFSAQYQQAPVPPGGAMIKRTWLRRYDHPPARTSSTRVVQSWDTASKDGGQNDWSVCTTWMIMDGRYYLIDVLRGRYDYPTLKARAIDHARAHKHQRVLIEEAGVGIALIQELKKIGLPTIGVNPERDKQTRMSIESAKFESGLVLFPSRAPWLDELEAQLLAFPHGRHDDQVDSINQALAKGRSGYDSFLSWV